MGLNSPPKLKSHIQKHLVNIQCFLSLDDLSMSQTIFTVTNRRNSRYQMIPLLQRNCGKGCRYRESAVMYDEISF